MERDDFDAFRAAARRTFSLWGGRYNPIIPVDDPAHARRLIDLFRVDCLFACTDSPVVRKFIDSQPHLRWPNYDTEFVLDAGIGERSSVFADITTPTQLAYDEHFKANPDTDSFLVLHNWTEEVLSV